MRCLASFIIVALVALLPVLNGCAGKQPTMHYYQLAPAASPAASAAEKLPDLALGVGPVSIPEMLKRQEIVVRDEGNQYRLTDLHRWAGLLEKDLEAAIIENLSRQLGTEQIVGYPWGSYFNPDYRIIIEILEFTGKPGGIVALRSGWTIVDRSGEDLLLRKISEYQQNSQDQSFGALIQAKNQLIAMLCQEISSALRNLEKSQR